jgi:hypothetical protein
MKRTCATVHVILLLSAFALSACDGGVDTSATPDQQPDQSIKRTIVWMNNDGTATVRDIFVSKEQNQKDMELREAFLSGRYTPAIVRDASCVGSSMWLYDQPNRGIGYPTVTQICFYESDTSPGWKLALDLGTYGWATRIRSFWGGSQDSYFYPTTLNCLEAYDAYALQNNATFCVAHADRMAFCGDANCYPN